MNYKKIKIARLSHYAEYLKKGNIKCERFYVENFAKPVANKNNWDENNIPIYFLPIMELPQIFQKDWYYDDDFMPVYHNDKNKDTVSSVLSFFGINRSIFFHLFTMGGQRPEIWGGCEFSENPSIPEVANNVEQLIEHLQFYSNINGNEIQIFLN